MLAAGKENKRTKQAEKEPRTRLIGLRLSEAEYSRIADELLVCGLSLSAFVRKRVFGQCVASKADLAVLAELRRFGGLLKHVHNETRGAYSALTAQAIRDLSAYVRALTEKHQRDTSGGKEANL
jgi:hypothetical protein